MSLNSRTFKPLTLDDPYAILVPAMAFSDYKFTACACTAIQSMGAFKDTFNTLITSVIGSLRATKILMEMFYVDYADQAELIALQAAFALVQKGIDTLQSPLVAAEQLLKPWSDCPPVQNWSKIVGEARNEVLAYPLKLQQEIKDKEAALNLAHGKIEKLQNAIDALEELKTAIEFCSEQGTV